MNPSHSCPRVFIQDPYFCVYFYGTLVEINSKMVQQLSLAYPLGTVKEIRNHFSEDV